jgi:predicted permease
MRSISALWQDLRVAFRVLGKAPGATILSLASIALGIGLTTAAFSIGDALLLRPFPIQRPSEVFAVVSRGDDGELFAYGWPDIEDMTAAAKGVAGIAGYQRRSSMLSAGDETESVLTHSVTLNYFSLLGVRAAFGAASVEPQEGRPAAVLGHRLWQRRFGGDPAVIGRTVILNQKPFVIAGVMPPEFLGLQRGIVTDVWMSTDAWFGVFQKAEDRLGRRGQFEVVARLEPGVARERAAAVLDAAIRGPAKHLPAPAGAAGTILDGKYAPSWKANLVIGGGLLAALILVLFVACANVAQLRLAQAETRRKEFAVRMALGAGGWRLTRQLLGETAVVGVGGSLAGVLAGQVTMEKAGQFLSGGRVYVDYGIGLDVRVLLFTICAVALSILLAGLAPARHAVRIDLAEVFKAEQGSTGARGTWTNRFLVAGQMAISVALFGTAILFLGSLRNALAVHPGLDPGKNLHIFWVGPSWRGQTVQWCEQACDRLAAVPGVRGATFARRLPLSGSGGGASVRVEASGQAPLGVHFNNVAGNYFSVMGTRVLAGRAIDANDRASSPPVVVISQHLARQAFPERSALGQWLKVEGTMRQVVGIAEDGPSNSLHEDPEPFLYLPFSQAPVLDITLMVEAESDPGLRKEVKRFDPGVVIYSSATLRQHMDRALSEDRMMAALAGLLGLVALLLTAAGLFGVMQYLVSRRTREFGLRMALGAEASELQRMVVRDALRLAAWGIPAGLALLAAATWYVRSMLLGVTPLDPAAYLLSALAAAALTLTAAWWPARRATRVDPMSALKYE